MDTAMAVLDELIGEDPGLVSVRNAIGRLLERDSDARRSPPILIQGETGTGKGVVARAIHRAGPRAAGPFVDVNCAAIPDTLLEAELFGFERGAFTDARQAKQGLFQAAHRGTLFLDEVGLLPEALQAKLLKVLEDRAVRRLGSTREPSPVDVWILSATGEDLEAAIRTRRFREDLYHRLAVVTLWLPPLRERGPDVLRLAEHFLARACADYALAPKRLTPEARAALLAYRWPGNVRELSNVMERVALLSEAALVTAATLGLPEASRAEPHAVARREAALSLEEAVDGVERAHLLDTLRQTDWNITRAAARLGISRNTLRYRIKKHGLQPLDRSARAPGFARAALHAAHSRYGGSGSAAGGVEGASAAVPGPPIPPDIPEAAPAPAGLRWERRHLTLLRVALVTRAAGAPPDTHRVLELLVEKVQSFGGRIEELGSTGIVAAFGLEPVEDAPRRAAHAAMAVLKASERAWRGGAEPPLAVKIGIHVCQVMTGWVGGRAEIDQDARRQAWAVLEAEVERAEPHTILVSEGAAPFLERRFGLTPMGSLVRASGRAYRLGGRERTGLGLGGRMARFVGRQRELEILEERYREARDGALQVVNIVGEAGIGKSRLAHELRQRLERSRLVVLQGQCTAFGRSTPFLPFIEVVRSAFLLEEADEPEEVTHKLRRGLHLLGLPVADTLPILQVLLGLEVEGDRLRGLGGEIVGARTREALHALLRERCRLSPVLLMLDDLHWADTASQELLLRVIQSEERLPLLILCAYRPPYRPPWAGRRGVTDLRLEPLSAESCLHLVQHRLGTETLPDALARLIVEKAEGNPLFAEELIRYLLERGSLRRIGSDVSFHPGADALAVPATLEDLLMARVERLSEGPRAVLQVASVVGRRFSLELMRTVSGVNGALARSLRDLEAQELIVRQETEGREEYRFTHVLVQEAIYENLPAPRREELHQRVAEAIERLYASRLGEWVEVLAHHYSHTPRVGQTVRYLALAGEKSLRVYSLEEADRRFREVVERVETVPGCADEGFLADALLAWAQVYYYRSDYTGLIALLERYRARVEALGDRRRLSLLLFWLGFSHVLAARCDVAKPLLEKALALGEALGDEQSTGYASMGLMYAYWVAPGGQPRDVVDRLGARILAIAERSGDIFLASQGLLCLALHKLTSGRYGEARELGVRLLELGRGASASRTMAMGLHALAFVNVYDERYEEAIAHAEEALRVAPDPADRLMGRAARGAALALMGRAEEGLENLREVRGELAGGEYLVLLLGVEFPYGAAMVRAGQIAAGVRWIEDAIRRFAGWGNESVPAFGHMFLGEIHLRMSLREEKVPLRATVRNLGFILRTRPFAGRKARRHFEEAIRIAREVGIPTVLARSLLGLGLLYRAEKREDEAGTHFEDAYRVAEPLGSPALLERIRAARETRRQGRTLSEILA
jgi:DNA-binding NtrC family response regulator/tetratricopeptide (TPR) repeat protein